MTTAAPFVSAAETRRLDSEIVDAMAKHNMSLPANFSFDAPGSVDVFLAVVKTANLSRDKLEAEEAAKLPPDVLAATTDPHDGFSNMEKGAQFSEDESNRTPFRRVTRMSPSEARVDCASRKSWSRK